MTVYSIEDVAFRYRDRPVLDAVSLTVAAGECVALVGRNGCGKSTLLRLLAGAARPAAGRVLLQGRDAHTLRRREMARQVAVLHQQLPPMPGMTVRQLVAQGRYPHRGPLGMLWRPDDEEAAAALRATGVEELAGRAVDTLSGGERQRVRLALALAQRTPVLLLDEPTTFLDLRHQLEVLSLVRELHAARGLTVVTVLHELDHAARFTDRIVALAGGRVAADGPPAEVLIPALLADVFGVRGRVLPDEQTGSVRTLADAPIPEGGLA
ncbi:ABC transporter ATP-binding protein [Micromonospora sp. CPCC 206061]|uniref:ABC transporter ATP-binding protein n=1 Tax=Micromonospora sp. CPCC 206061 TaxID=3122410 RepID=UPI002FF1413A